MSLTLAALAVFTSVTLVQLWRTEQDPARTRAAYAATREARGLPVDPERLDVMFSPAGRRVAWAIAAVFCLAPLTVLLWRRQDFEPLPDNEGAPGLDR
ncbi:MAG: hypothetical protein R2712_16805 [Vicinamibacterales bacterium]